jgi:hypothetical protein
MKYQSTLYDWRVEDMGECYVLVGKVKGDERWPDGTLVHTSELQRIDFTGRVAETMNTIYELV